MFHHNNEQLTKSLELHTKLSDKMQKRLVRWFAKQNVLIKTEIFSEQKNQFFKIRNNCKIPKIAPLAAFFLAIKHYHNLEQTAKRKNKMGDLKQIRKISEFTIKKSYKFRIKEKRERLLNLWGVVERLKEEGFSYREISQYLKGHHRFEISHTYIQKIWEELKNAER